MQEELKGLTAYIDGKVSSATFKWGFGNNVDWNWKIKYFGREFTKTTLKFVGYWEEPMPEFPTFDTSKEKRWWNNMPTSVELTHSKVHDYINIYLRSVGVYFAQVYRKENDQYILYDVIEEFDGQTDVLIKTPRMETFWIVIYVQELGYQKKSWTYLGDMEFRYPLHWLGATFG